MDTHRGQREHVLRRPLTAAIESAGSDPDDIAEAVLKSLDEQRIISYAPRDTLAILPPAGRVLVILCEKPNATLREISLMLGVNESNVARSVGKLVRANVIARTKVKGRNVYTLNNDVARLHPDLRRYHDAVLQLLGASPLEDE